VGVFCHMAQVWKEHVDKLTSQNVLVSHYNLVPEYMKVRHQFITYNIITNAFKTSRIQLFNPNIFTEDDYAPSKAFSTKAHAPKNFPDNIPSSDIAITTDCTNDSDGNLDNSDDNY
jgi:hypothetical protein